MARVQHQVPRGPSVFHGLLHDCVSTGLTDTGARPKPDEDGWEQYCFQDPTDLGENKLFIEFFINWNEWGDMTKLTKKDFIRERDDNNDLIREITRRPI